MVIKAHHVIRKSGTIRSKQLQGKLSVALLNSQKRVLKRLQEYTSTWNHQPFFDTTKGTKYAGGDIKVELYVDDPIFWYLEEGTDVRYAVMEHNFVPKTKPGRIASQQGQGGFDYLDRMPHEGIEARHVIHSIIALEDFQFRNDVLNVVMDIDFLDFGAEEGMLG